MLVASRRRVASVVALVALLTASLLAVSPVAAAPPDDLPGPPSPPADLYASGQAALDRLGDRLPVVAEAYGLNPGELRTMLLADATLFVDTDDALAYFDVLAPGEPDPAEPDPAEPAEAPTAVAAPPTTGPEFQLASLPGADKTIYLDFDGHTTTGTTWNSQYGVSTIVSPPYDTNGNPDAWSAAELAVIRDTWAVVAEDFAPWNINVTTIEPTDPGDLIRSGSGDTRWGARVVITDDTFANCGCGGHAYIGAFDDNVDEPTFVYNTSFVGVAEASTHEVGHMMNLSHDGSAVDGAYSFGHSGPGETGWAPIMGAAYYEPVSQWSRQEFTGANNNGSSANYGNGPDDIAIISSLTNGNGFGLRPDDHGDDAAGATPLSGSSPVVDGIIGTRTDVDVFSFTTTGGTASFSAGGPAVRNNLDIELTLRDGTGSVVATADPTDLLSATLTTSLAAGGYTVEVTGVGVGNPLADPPVGYTDYGSLGQYTLAGTIVAGPPDTTPPAVPTGFVGMLNGSDVLLGWADNTESDLAGYIVRWSTMAGGPYTTIATPSLNGYLDVGPPTGPNHYVVAARDQAGNVSAYTDEVTVTVPDTPEVADGETIVAGTVSGTRDDTHQRGGGAQTITEVDSGGKPSDRHDLAEHRWSIPAAGGNQTLTIVATSTASAAATSGDTGFSIEWSNDGSTWIPLALVSAENPVDQAFDIGGPTGSIQVRVVDNDRTPGERSHDSVSVDLLQLTGDGGPVEPPPDPTQAIATLTVGTQGVGKGEQQGVATVVVVDDQGNPVDGADVTVVFTADLAGTVTGTTDATGTVVVTTSGAMRKPSIAACVAAVSASGLTWAPGAEAC